MQNIPMTCYLQIRDMATKTADYGFTGNYISKIIEQNVTKTKFSFKDFKQIPIGTEAVTKEM